MSREIKFRSWLSDTVHKENQQIISTGASQKDMISFWRNYYSWQGDIKKLMQFTGLRDKNGREIYEGDIVRWGHNINTIGESMGVCFDGGFSEGIGVIDITPLGIYIGDDKPLWDMLEFMCGGVEDNVEEFEIIGNIYENPELMEGR